MINFTVTKEDIALATAKQFIADIYHCSDNWGVTMSEDDMRENLQQWAMEADPGTPVPDISMAAELTAYWNELCRLYPS